jgi:ribonuclease D
MAITLHQGDIPVDLEWGEAVAIDSETMGLRPERDRLCLVQLSAGDGDAHLIQFQRLGSIDGDAFAAPNLRALLTNPDVTKIFHFARFDVAVLKRYLGIDCQPIYCTKIASKLVRTYTDRHGLKDICRELLGIDLVKEQQSSDWGAEKLSKAQLEYAAADVLHLHALREALDAMLVRERREDLADACFRFLAVRAQLDLDGWDDTDIFAHS